jgi:type IV pilus assembly protein PilW
MRRQQSGFTLVEILVALLIGLFLMGGLVSLTSNNKRTYSNQNALAQLQDNQRFALSVLTEVIQHAGYFPDANQGAVATDDMPLLAPNFTTKGQPFYGVPQAGATPESISTQYALGTLDAVLTCAGQQNTGALKAYVNIITVVPPPDAQHPMDGQLTCTVQTSAGKQAPVVLVTGVNNIQVLYGINDAHSATTHDVTQYKLAGDMTNLDWFNVTAVQVTLTFANPLFPQAAQPQTIPITWTIGIMTRAGVTT